VFYTQSEKKIQEIFSILGSSSVHLRMLLGSTPLEPSARKVLNETQAEPQ
jgi:hypothetical protein